MRPIKKKCECGHPETLKHLLQCPLITTIHNEIIKQLRKIMLKMKTLSHLQTLIIKLSLQSQKRLVFPKGILYEQELKKALRQKQEIGDHKIWKGIITQSIGDI